MALESSLGDAAIVLVCLALTTLGGRVALHFLYHERHRKKTNQRNLGLTVSPHLFPSLSSLSTTLLSLMLAGGGTLALNVLSTVSGHDMSSLRLLLTRAMSLICPLLFARHIGIALGHPFTLLARKCSRGENRGLESIILCKGLRRISKGVLQCCRSVLECYLWAVATGATVINFLQPADNLYPCWIPVSMSDQYSSSRSTTYSLFPDIVLKSAEMSTTADRTPQTATAGAPESYARIAFLLCGGTCVRQVFPEVLLYCVFSPPLLLYIILSGVMFSLTEVPHPKQNVDDIRCKQQAFCDRKCFWSDIPIVRDQKNPIRLSSDLVLSHKLISLTGDISVTQFPSEITPYKNVSREHLGGCIMTNDALVRHEDNMIAHDDESYSAVSGVQVAAANQNQQAMEKVGLFQVGLSDDQIVQVKSEGHCLPELSVELREEKRQPVLDAEQQPQDELCSVCLQLSPYVLLAGSIICVQCVVLWPLWGLAVVEKCGQLKFLSPEFSFLPVFTAICFVFRAIDTSSG